MKSNAADNACISNLSRVKLQLSKCGNKNVENDLKQLSMAARSKVGTEKAR